MQSLLTRNFSTIRQNTGSKRFVINLSSNVLLVVLNIVAGIWFTPYLLNHLGVALYGIVILANTVTNYMGVVNSAISNSVGRFLALDVQKLHMSSANRTFNTALWTSIAIMLGLLPFTLGFGYITPYIFDVPLGYEQAVQWLFIITMFSYLIVIIRSVFLAATFARNRLDLQNTVLCSNILFRILVVVGLFSIAAKPEVWHVGVGTIAGVIFASILAVIIWRRLTPDLTIDRHQFDRESLRNMSGTSGWVFINQIGSLLFLNIDIVIINMALGAEAGGHYATVFQWSVLLRTLAQTVSSALAPVILSKIAQSNTRSVQELSRLSVRLMGVALALPIGIITAFAEPLLTLWVGPSFTQMATILRILIAQLCVNLAVLPLFSVQLAMNKVRWPGIVTLVMGIINVILAIIWVGWGSYGLGVAVAGAIVLTLKNALFVPIYVSYIQKLPWFTYFRDMLPGIIATIAVWGISTILTASATLDSWNRLGAATVPAIIVWATLIYGFRLNKLNKALN